MMFQFSLYLVPLVFGSIVCAGLAAFVYCNRNKRTALPTFGILVGVALWAGADALRFASVDLQVKMLWQSVRYLAIGITVGSIFFHALEYTNRDRWVTRRTVALVATLFILTNVFAWTEPLLGHGLFYSGHEVFESSGLVFVSFEYGPARYATIVYGYVLVLATMGMYFVESVRRTGTYRFQAIGLFFATMAPWALNVFNLVGYSPVDLTAFGFTVTGAIFVVQFYRFQLLEVVPVARSTAINHFENGYLVFDTEGTVLDLNDAAADLLDMERESVIGTHVDEIMAQFPNAAEEFGDEWDVDDDVTIYQNGERREYDVDSSPVYDHQDHLIAWSVLIRDVTEERRRQRTLEERTAALKRQNERLDRFASIVSHDLRNPIAVAKGHLEIARSEGEPDSFDRVEQALTRMEEITEDVLTLARQEQDAVEPERVELSVIAEQAWDTVDTDAATLDVETTRTISADPGQLRSALENLFRNSVQHGPSDVTVRVGDTEEGFYVEDDGPGIPSEDMADVFEPGFTTDDGGTGFGLAIVNTSAEAHDWSVDVADGRDGGVRFEFSGVEDLPDVETSVGNATT